MYVCICMFSNSALSAQLFGWNERGEPCLHRIKWHHVDQCAQALLTSKVLGCPPLGQCFASFSFLGSVLAQLDASISGDSGTVSLVQFIDHVVIVLQIDVASLGNPRVKLEAT